MTARMPPIWAHTMRGVFRSPSRWANRAAKLGLSGAIVTLNNILTGQFLAPLDRAQRMVTELAEAGLQVGALVCPRPGDPQRLADYCAEIPLSLIALDLEENWGRAQRRQHVDWDLAGGQLVHAFRTTCPDARLGVTSIAYRGRDPKLAAAIDACDFVLPQGMASNKVGPDKNHDGKPDWRSMPPGRAQTFAHAKWSGHDKPHGMVLAAYSQSGIAGHTPASAMQTSLDAALATEPELVTYWELRALWRRRKVLPWLAGT